MSLDKNAWISILSLLQESTKKNTPFYEAQHQTTEHSCIQTALTHYTILVHATIVWRRCWKFLKPATLHVLRADDLGLKVTEIPSDENQPDGVFVSDIAVVIGSVALICNPPRFNNRPSRQGEVRPFSVRGRIREFSKKDRVRGSGVSRGKAPDRCLDLEVEVPRNCMQQNDE